MCVILEQSCRASIVTRGCVCAEWIFAWWFLQPMQQNVRQWVGWYYYHMPMSWSYYQLLILLLREMLSLSMIFTTSVFCILLIERDSPGRWTDAANNLVIWRWPQWPDLDLVMDTLLSHCTKLQVLQDNTHQFHFCSFHGNLHQHKESKQYKQEKENLFDTDWQSRCILLYYYDIWSDTC